MPTDDIRILLFSIAFGALMGWGLGFRAEDRRVAFVTTGLTIAAGLLTWLLMGDADPTGLTAVAATSLTFGGAAALLMMAITGKR